MNFASDNAGPVHPKIMSALARVNDGYAMAYGNDPETAAAQDAVRRLFEAPDAAVFLVAGGSAANALALGTMVQPYQAVFVSHLAHVHVDECGAPEFYTGGAKLVPVGEADRITPDALRRAIAKWDSGDVHQWQAGALSITNATEFGNLYTLDEIRALSAVAKAHGMGVHFDGARLANACAKLGCSPAELTWKAGADVAVLGGTKNGCMGVEAVVFFDPAKAASLPYRRMRGGHLLSKHRYLAAQMNAYLADDLWLELASRANATCAALAAGLLAEGIEILNKDWANMLFFRAPMALHDALRDAGAVYHYGPDADTPETGTGRLVCDWSLSEDAVARFLETLRGLARR